MTVIKIPVQPHNGITLYNFIIFTIVELYTVVQFYNLPVLQLHSWRFTSCIVTKLYSCMAVKKYTNCKAVILKVCNFQLYNCTLYIYAVMQLYIYTATKWYSYTVAIKLHIYTCSCIVVQLVIQLCS